ncbi:nuclear pore complex protein Nup50 [Cyclopterus lumpus]|uniref:nuclear pore complex protein Nup50 n=1 Tax=Cyclopterus lumpus TaxID=8103 RepID=UPI001486503D|nr:nuclear pore complex protein Nup50 [Cyclopterus lumpus]XP_034382621.1 nuclear pore complex protein Nup50 [Cyclopterus lumpus]XP_034382622.1 nuclear pore complex protein Nup50 [Cyclopterus lumpus]
MAKRIADKELTDRNWDQVEEEEEAGSFLVASEDVLKSRPIKKAKRRTIGEADGSGSFKGFKGFSLSSSPTAFSGFGNGGGFTGLNGTSSAAPFKGFSSPTATPGLTFTGPASSDITAQQTNGCAPSPAPSSGSNKEYSRQLTALNCSVRDWITKHVNGNPLCDLNPIFRDYERHLASIERQYGAGSSDGGSKEEEELPAAAPLPPPAASSSSSLFSFSKTLAEDSAKSPGVSFNFGQKVDASLLGSLGSKATPPSFSFSSSQTSLFGAPAPRPPDENGEEESEEPPKADIKEVKEDDAFYSKKCKLFYKKDSEFKEKGVGTLHLKETGDGKVQMIIRADTNLGKILLNILLQASMPVSRVGRNNVMVVCVPNPTLDEQNPGSPIPLLIRVKTSEDADELHETLQKKRGGP